jgi:MoaA/NifB/PqqE/SkfB family radical SAM enzyme
LANLVTPPSLIVRRAARMARQALPIVNLGVRRLSGKKSPFQMSLSLTNRCNFRCEYCDIPNQYREEMSLEEWKGAIDELRAGGMGRASLIGGEPLVHRHVGEIIDHLRLRGVHIAMNSNGWLLRDRIEDVQKLDLVCLTLDGPREVHDEQRRKGSYDRVIEGLGLLCARDIPVVTMTVLTPRGADNVDHVLDIAAREGFKAFFQLEHDKNCDVMEDLAPRLSDERIAALADHLIEAKDRGLPVGNSRSMLERQKRQRYLGTCSDCYAGEYYGYVFSDGTVAPCLFTQWQQEAQNGRRRGFLRAFEQLAEPRGPGCSCFPTHSVNEIIALDPGALWHAFGVTLGLPVGG